MLILKLGEKNVCIKNKIGLFYTEGERYVKKYKKINKYSIGMRNYPNDDVSRSRTC